VIDDDLRFNIVILGQEAFGMISGRNQYPW